MSQRHPIDDLFRRRLKEHEVAPPMHVWRRLQESRRRSAVAGIQLASAARIWWLAAGTLLAVLIPASEWKWHLAPAQVKPDIAKEVQLPKVNALSGRLVEESSNVASPSRRAIASATALPVQAYTYPEQSSYAMATHLAPTHTQEEILPGGISGAGAGDAASPGPGAMMEASFLPARAGFQVSPTVRNRAFPGNSKCATFKDMGLRIHAELLASPQYAFRNLEPRSASPDLEAYAGLRAETEQPGFHYSVDMRVSAATNFGLVARTGIQYNVLQEKLRYVAETEQRFTIVNILSPDGQVIRIDTIYETLHREKTIANRYEMLHVPVLVGYELPLKRWLFTVQGGALVNVLFRQQGAMFLPQGGEMPSYFAALEQEGIAVFRRRLGVGWYAAAGVAYKIHPRLQVMAEPHVQSFPRAITAPSHPVAQRYTLAGVSVGLRYQM